MKKNKLLGVIVVSFLIITIYNFQVHDIFITDFQDNLNSLFNGMANPSFNSFVLGNLGNSLGTTLIFSTVGLILGIYLGLLFSYFGSKFRLLKIGKLISIILRSSHELVYVYLLLIIFGLNVYVAIIGISLSFGGIIGKIFIDNMNLVSEDSFKVQNLRGLSYGQNFVFNLLPNSFQRNLDYLEYRYECALRSTIILGYIGLPGIGFYISMAINDGNYNSLFAYIYGLIIFIFIFNLITRSIINKIGNRLSLFLKFFIPSSIIILGAFYYYYSYSFGELFSSQNLLGLQTLFQGFKDLLSLEGLNTVGTYLSYTKETILLGIIGTVIMSIFLIGHFVIYFISRYLNNNYRRVSGYNILDIIKFVLGKVLMYYFQLINLILRAIPEIVFLSILLFVMKPTIISGALSIALHNGGITTRILSKYLENNYKRKIDIFLKKGFGPLNLMFFVAIPFLKKEILSIISYRFEMMIKVSVVIGILGAGGLGYLFRIEMAKYNYSSIFMIIIIYIVLLLILDKIHNIVSGNKKKLSLN